MEGGVAGNTAGTKSTTGTKGAGITTGTRGAFERSKEIRKYEKKKTSSKSTSSSSASLSSFFSCLARLPRTSLHSLHSALRGRHWSSSGHSSTTCVSVITSPHLHVSVSALPILCSHPFCDPLSDRHQVYADKAFRHYPSRPFPFPPLASAFTLLAHALRPAGVTMPSD